jgi:hypothetical protein
LHLSHPICSSLATFQILRLSLYLPSIHIVPPFTFLLHASSEAKPKPLSRGTIGRPEAMVVIKSTCLLFSIRFTYFQSINPLTRPSIKPSQAVDASYNSSEPDRLCTCGLILAWLLRFSRCDGMVAAGFCTLANTLICTTDII